MFAKRLFKSTLILILLLSFLAISHGSAAAGSGPVGYGPVGYGTGGSCASTYVVQPGDWLSKIANRCGVSLSALYAANPYVGNYIYAGQVLNIPGGNGYYASYNGPYNQPYNQPYNGTYYGPVPGSGGPVPGNGAYYPGNYQPYYGNGYYYCGPTSNTTYGRYYVVCRGDTLLKIALYYGERLSYLQWHNHIYNADRIYAGQFIFP
jgi:LysM repeat protein